MEVKFAGDKASIEGLTFRQLALIESLVNVASRSGGYQFDIDDYKEIMEGFKVFNIKDIFDLAEEKRQIQETMRKWMQENKVKSFRDSFSMIQQCNDDEVRTIRLRDLMTEMEGKFNIPLLNDEKYNRANPTVIELYLAISNARVF